jgi:hypothetical protein
MKNDLESTIQKAWAQPVEDNLKIDFQIQTPAPRDTPDTKSKAQVPVLYNRANVADELNMPKIKIFRAYAAGLLDPDAFMCDGQPLFFACRVNEIAILLNGKKS